MASQTFRVRRPVASIFETSSTLPIIGFYVGRSYLGWPLQRAGADQPFQTSWQDYSSASRIRSRKFQAGTVSSVSLPAVGATALTSAIEGPVCRAGRTLKQAIVYTTGLTGISPHAFSCHRAIASPDRSFWEACFVAGFMVGQQL